MSLITYIPVRLSGTPPLVCRLVGNDARACAGIVPLGHGGLRGDLVALERKKHRIGLARQGRGIGVHRYGNVRVGHIRGGNVDVECPRGERRDHYGTSDRLCGLGNGLR